MPPLDDDHGQCSRCAGVFPRGQLFGLPGDFTCDACMASHRGKFGRVRGFGKAPGTEPMRPVLRSTAVASDAAAPTAANAPVAAGRPTPDAAVAPATDSASAPASDSAPAGPAGGPCPHCGRACPTRFSETFAQVVSVLVITFSKADLIEGCRSCCLRIGLKRTAITFVAGWWGIPFGILFTPVALLKNVPALLRLYRAPDPG
ncbi:MAG: hypothetical protein HZA54_13195 [Planctomycetes bacterium]|nr:hypothetical protein [Planctomycetota bacterium]